MMATHLRRKAAGLRQLVPAQAETYDRLAERLETM